MGPSRKRERRDLFGRPKEKADFPLGKHAALTAVRPAIINKVLEREGQKLLHSSSG